MTGTVQFGFNPTVYNTTVDAGFVNLIVQRNGTSNVVTSVNITTVNVTAIGIYKCLDNTASLF